MAETARLLTYQAAWLHDTGRPCKQAAAMAKLHTTEAAVSATRIATQIFGGYGFIDETPGGPLLPRRQDPRDRRGHQRGPAPRDQPRAGPAGPMSRRDRARRRGPAHVARAAAPGLQRRGRACVLLTHRRRASAYVYSKYSRSCRGSQLGSVLTEHARTSDGAAELPARRRRQRRQPGRGRPRPRRPRQRRRAALRHGDGAAGRPGAERASLLSLPRDLWVPLASGGNQRINSAIQNGGPGELIDTIEQLLRASRSTTTSRSTSPASRSSSTSSTGSTVYFADPGPRLPLRPRHRHGRVRHPRRPAGPRATCGPATSSTTRTALAQRRRPPTWGASAASRTSSSARCTERSPRACATRSPSIGS